MKCINCGNHFPYREDAFCCTCRTHGGQIDYKEAFVRIFREEEQRHMIRRRTDIRNELKVNLRSVFAEDYGKAIFKAFENDSKHWVILCLRKWKNIIRAPEEK